MLTPLSLNLISPSACPSPCSSHLTLCIHSSPPPHTSILLLPCAWGPVEVIYLSVKRLVMTTRQEAPGPWHWMLRWRLHEVHSPGATINVKCNKRPVNKIEHCHSPLIDCPSRRWCLCVCVCQCINPTLFSFRIKKQQILDFIDTILSQWLWAFLCRGFIGQLCKSEEMLKGKYYKCVIKRLHVLHIAQQKICLVLMASYFVY